MRSKNILLLLSVDIHLLLLMIPAMLLLAIWKPERNCFCERHVFLEFWRFTIFWCSSNFKLHIKRWKPSQWTPRNGKSSFYSSVAGSNFHKMCAKTRTSVNQPFVMSLKSRYFTNTSPGIVTTTPARCSVFPLRPPYFCLCRIHQNISISRKLQPSVWRL